MVHNGFWFLITTTIWTNCSNIWLEFCRFETLHFIILQEIINNKERTTHTCEVWHFYNYYNSNFSFVQYERHASESELYLTHKDNISSLKMLPYNTNTKQKQEVEEFTKMCESRSVQKV